MIASDGSVPALPDRDVKLVKAQERFELGVTRSATRSLPGWRRRSALAGVHSET